MPRRRLGKRSTSGLYLNNFRGHELIALALPRPDAGASTRPRRATNSFAQYLKGPAPGSGDAAQAKVPLFPGLSTSNFTFKHFLGVRTSSLAQSPVHGEFVRAHVHLVTQ